MTFVRRKIDVGFQLSSGTFSDGQSNAVTLSGLHVTASIRHTGGVEMSECEVSVYGMTTALMNQLSTLGRPIYTYGTPGGADPRNIITVSAGDDDSGMAVAFTGHILQAWADGQGAPEIPFRVTAQVAGQDKATPLPPTSIGSPVDAATMIGGIATQLGRNLENSGVQVQLPPSYFTGSGYDQIMQICQAANIECVFEGAVGAGEAAGSGLGGATVAIWPKGQARGGVSLTIGPGNKLVGYPAWTSNGIVLKAEYLPTITYGAPITVQNSSIVNTNGAWQVFNLSHDLESESANGPWFTNMECALFGHPLPVASSGA